VPKLKENIMGLLNQPAASSSGTSLTSQATGVAPAAAKVEKKVSKKSAERRQAKLNAALLLVSLLSDNKIVLNEAQQAAADLLTKAPRVGGGGGFGGEPIFNKIFGATPKAGDKITIQEVFAKTFKGVSQMNSLVRKWAAKNVAIVEYVHNEAEPFKSTYTIKSIGTGKASAVAE
jgi:hypothetical protein